MRWRALPGCEIANDDRRQRIGAFEPHHVAREYFEIEHIGARTIRESGRAISRVRGDASGAVMILKSMAPSALVRMNSSSPRSATEYCTPSSRAAIKARFCVGLAEIDQPLLGGFVIAAGDHAEAAAGALMNMREPAGVRFLMHQHVLGLRCAEPVAIDLHRAVVVVELDVVERAASPCVHTTPPSVSSITSARSVPLSQSRTRIVKYSEPRSSALHASRR